MEIAPVSEITQAMVDCAVHGLHEHFLTSTIEGFEGAWCMKCLLKRLGPPQELVQVAAEPLVVTVETPVPSVEKN